MTSYWAIIPAAGIGARMQSTLPKQYIKILDKPILEYSIDKIASIAKIEKVVVALNSQDHYWSALNLAYADKIITTIGGNNRVDSVMQGLNIIKSFAKKNDWVLVHDAVRPCVAVKDINNLIEHTQHDAVGAILGVPARDTLKRVDDNLLIEKTICREKVFHAQTPQLFRFHILYEAIHKALQQGLSITDESSAVEYLQKKPTLLIGSLRNIKITYPDDLWLAEQYLKEEQ